MESNENVDMIMKSVLVYTAFFSPLLISGAEFRILEIYSILYVAVRFGAFKTTPCPEQIQILVTFFF